MLLYQFREEPIGHHPGATRIDHEGDGPGNAYGVGDLDLALPGEPRRHNVLGGVPAHVRRGTVHLGGVLAGKGAPTVGDDAAIGVDDDLPAGHARVGHGPPYDETARGVHQYPGGRLHQVTGQDGIYYLPDDVPVDLLRFHRGVMLGRDDHRVDPQGLSVFVIDGDLGLPVGTQVSQGPVLSDLAQPPRQPVGQGNG